MRRALLFLCGGAVACGAATTDEVARVDGLCGGAEVGGAHGLGGGGGVSNGDGLGGAPQSVTGGARTIPPCVDPQPVGGPESGMVRCADGWVRRLGPGKCADRRAETGCEGIVPERFAGEGWPYAHCEQCSGLGGHYFSFGCVEDADCDYGELCACGDEIGKCVEAYCSGPEDCGPEEACVLARTVGCISAPVQELRCQRADDECLTDEDCYQPTYSHWYCGSAAGEAKCVEFFQP